MFCQPENLYLIVLFSIQDSRGSSKRVSHESGKQRRVMLQGTRKVNCPAEIQIRTVKIFPEYQVDVGSCKSLNSVRVMKEGALTKLKNALQEENKIVSKIHHYVRIPLPSAHIGHPTGERAGLNQTVNKKVISKIYELVKKSVTNFNEVKRSLISYVELELFQGVPDYERPKRNNRQYYPTNEDIQNHIIRAIMGLKKTKDDQEWKKKSPKSKFFYREYNEVKEEKTVEVQPESKKIDKHTFLFVHQEPWQQRLLRRYGSRLVFMDATYKTSKYALPLFFLCVHTNNGYKVVGEFMCQYETQVCISEALKILKEWNPWWKPNYWMVDFSIVEISAIETEFQKQLFISVISTDCKPGNVGSEKAQMG